MELEVIQEINTYKLSYKIAEQVFVKILKMMAI